MEAQRVSAAAARSCACARVSPWPWTVPCGSRRRGGYLTRGACTRSRTRECSWVVFGIVLPVAMLAYLFQSEVLFDPVAAWHALHLEPGECGEAACEQAACAATGAQSCTAKARCKSASLGTPCPQSAKCRERRRGGGGGESGHALRSGVDAYPKRRGRRNGVYTLAPPASAIVRGAAAALFRSGWPRRTRVLLRALLPAWRLLRAGTWQGAGR